MGAVASLHAHFSCYITEGEKSAYLYEDGLSIIVFPCHPWHCGEGDSVIVLRSLHLHCQALLLLSSNERRELPGVALQLRVPELIQRSDVGQLPLRFHK